MENVWEVRQGQGEQGELLAEHQDEEDKAHSDNCLERMFHCLSHVPCASLVAWLALLIGLGGVCGGLLVGTFRSRDLLEEDKLLWFIEYSLIGIMSGMFVIGTCLLLLGHFSSEPNSRHCFNTSRKNACAQGLNIFMMVLTYILCLGWIFVSAVLLLPAAMLVLLIYLTDYKDFSCINLANYGFKDREICDAALERFVNHGWDLLICYLVAYFAAVVVIISLIHFLTCLSANITHLKDARFATLNAYEDADEAAVNSKHVNDTTM